MGRNKKPSQYTPELVASRREEAEIALTVFHAAQGHEMLALQAWKSARGASWEAERVYAARVRAWKLAEAKLPPPPPPAVADLGETL